MMTPPRHGRLFSPLRRRARPSAGAAVLLALLAATPAGAAPPAPTPAPPARHPPKILFFYPHDDLFWADSIRYAQAAAASLHAELEPINYGADSGRQLLLKMGRRLKQGPCDGIIVRFGDSGAEAVLSMAEKADIPVISINSSPPELNSEPRTQYTRWIARITPQDEQAGAIVAQQLVAAARARQWSDLHVLAVSGGRLDTVANARVRGFRRQMGHVREVRSAVVVDGDWDPKRAVDLFRKAVAEDPLINVVWCANDNMALAVRDEADRLGLGDRLVIGGIDWSAAALEAVAQKRLQVSVGGHFLEAAMAVVLMDDYLGGRDFAGDGTNFSTSLMAFSPDNSALLQGFLRTPADRLDFRALSKAHNPARARYTTDIFQIISALHPVSVVSLTPKERAWLAAHPVVPVAMDPAGFPIEWRDGNGHFHGPSLAFVRHFEEKLGIRLQPVAADPKRLLNGGIPLSFSLSPSAPAARAFQFCAPYQSYSISLFAKAGVPYMGQLAPHTGKRVAVVSGADLVEQLREAYPAAKAVPVADTAGGFRAVLDGRADFFAECTPVGNYFLASHHMDEIALCGETTLRRQMAVAVHRGDPELFSMAQKVLATMTDAEKAALTGRQSLDLPPMPFDWRPVGYLLGILLPIAGVVLVWNRRLSREVRTRRRVETELVGAKERAEAANRAKSTFLATMSHEIRTPMNGVLGMAELLAHTPLEPLQREQLAMIRGSGEALLAVINDILDFSKIEAGGMEYEKVGFSLHELAGRTLQALSPQAAAKNLELELDIPADLPDLRLGDPGRLRQVMTNLVGNAIKFTESGWIRMKVAAGAGPNALRVEVVDTGEGISQEAQTRLFQPFSQADASTTRKHGGTGLGLVISARIISQMGGRTGVVSELGRGSTFWFELVLPPASVQEVVSLEDRMPDTLAQFAGKSVLVVDDNAINRAVACAQMRRWGMRVADAPSAAQALAQLQAAMQPGHDAFDAVVLDGMMPGMDGWQLAGAIRKIPGCAGLPLIMASSAGSRSSLMREENKLFQRFLQKPLRPVQLAGALAEVLTDWRPGKPAAAVPVARPMRVLLVEDVPANQMVARAMLQKGGHQVTVAGNGAEALARLEEPDAFDIVLMDCQMPEMDGFEATRRLRLREKERGWNPLRVVAMTANAMQGDRELCLAAGMDGYLAKPVRMAQLLEVVGRG